jgi:hypothetical protein
LIDISDLGCKENDTRLRDTARQILELIPLDNHVTATLNQCFKAQTAINNEHLPPDESFNRLKTFYFQTSPSQMLYNLKATLIDFSPANLLNIPHIKALHVRFLNSSGLTCLLDILTQKQYTDQCDIITRKSIYLIILYILKRFLIILGFYQLKSTESSVYSDSLDQILNLMPMTTIYNEQQRTTTSVEKDIAALLIQHNATYPIPANSFLKYNHIVELIRLIWCLASNNKQNSFETNLKSDFSLIHKTFKQDNVSFIHQKKSSREYFRGLN